MKTRRFVLSAGFGLFLLLPGTSTVTADEPKTKVREIEISGPEDENKELMLFAREQRIALQMQKLTALRDEIEAKLKILDEKKAEWEALQESQQAAPDLANKAVVSVYSKMRPDAAAGRLAVLDRRLAAEILMKLKPRLSGTILNEMSTEEAARLTALMASMPQPQAKQ